jgi:hypothetical protein
MGSLCDQDGVEGPFTRGMETPIRGTVKMASGATLKVRRCRNQAEHTPHRWRGLNTRHHGYYCEGRLKP